MELITNQIIGSVNVENYDQFKQALETTICRYQNVVYTSKKDAEADEAKLKSLKKEIDGKLKEVKKSYLKPFEDFEKEIKVLLAMIDGPLKNITDYLSSLDREQREKDIKEYYDSISSKLGPYKDVLYNSQSFIDAKWFNKSTSIKKYQDELKSKVEKCIDDINTIQLLDSSLKDVLMVRYFECLDIDQVIHFNNHLNESYEGFVQADDSDDLVTGYKVLKIHGTRRQMERVYKQLELMNVSFEEIEDGMPKDFEQLSEPNFDSFVAFDIEHSGTFGAVNGDVEPEITEIGAVKVINGEVVDHFSMLANPGRLITPQNERLTHITNEMVKDYPPVSVVIKAFKEYVGDMILIGHNIRSVDLPYIQRAANKNGIQFENQYFDTYRYAEQFKESMNWDNVKLEYLAGQFGIKDESHHRAFNDAQVNVDVYFKLQQLKG